ncbi:unnamed protein product [Victoria cruziana]
MAAGVADVTWVRHMLGELYETILSSTMLCDNQSAISIALNPVLHSHTKHIEIEQHFVHQKIEDKELDLMYVSTHEQVADIFTKDLTRQQHWNLKDKLNMVLHHAQLEGGC